METPLDSPHDCQWRVTLMFSLIWSWTNGWEKKRDAGDCRRHRAHFELIVMFYFCLNLQHKCSSVETQLTIICRLCNCFSFLLLKIVSHIITSFCHLETCHIKIQLIHFSLCLLSDVSILYRDFIYGIRLRAAKLYNGSHLVWFDYVITMLLGPGAKWLKWHPWFYRAL